MTDEQFERLIEAINSPIDIIVAVVIALLSAGAGFGLALVTDHISRGRERRAAEIAERLSIAHDAAAWAFRVSSASWPRLRELGRPFQMESAAYLVRLRALDADDVVGTWYLRRLETLFSPPADGRDWSGPERSHRTGIAMEVSDRMTRWARREITEDEFRDQ